MREVSYLTNMVGKEVAEEIFDGLQLAAASESMSVPAG
jgi:hypothetical protein